MGELAKLAHIKKLDAAEVGRKPVGTPGQKEGGVDRGDGPERSHLLLGSHVEGQPAFKGGGAPTTPPQDLPTGSWGLLREVQVAHTSVR